MKIFTNYLAAIFILVATAFAYSDDSALIEHGIALKAKAESGDGDAMMELAELLMKHAPEPKRPYKVCDGKFVNPLIRKNTEGQDCKTVVDNENQRLIDLWKPIGNKYSSGQWINRAAESGNRRAISIKCGPKDDELAPAEMREQAETWCKKL